MNSASLLPRRTWHQQKQIRKIEISYDRKEEQKVVAIPRKIHKKVFDIFNMGKSKSVCSLLADVFKFTSSTGVK